MSTHRFGVTPEQLWDAIDDVRRYPSWWSWLRDFQADGERLRPGLVMRGRVVPPVPYAMQVTVEVHEVAPMEQVRARVRGDLEGPAGLVLRRTEDGCEVTVCWRVEMCRGAMRSAARVARPVLVWGHDRVVAVTVRGLRRHLDAATPG